MYLHSTMYLLKLVKGYIPKEAELFTFHHVSIKTHIIIILELPLLFNVILSTS